MAPDPRTETEGPLIGALLRACWQSVRDRIEDDLRARGFEDIGAAHLAVLQWPSPRGVRVTTLASRARMSRQAMNYLIRELEGTGYLERRRDPSDGRARMVHLTKRGEAAIRSIRASVRRLEREWERDLGARRFAQFLSALVELSSSSRDGDAPRDGE
jgi:DNA-binding MarR family transcriptional regulator